MKYREEINKTVKFKEEYLKSIEELIEKRQQEAETIRDKYFSDFLKNQEVLRQDFKKMLGWPLCEERSVYNISQTECEKLSEEEGYTLFRMQFEILGNVKISGLFFKIKTNDKKPLVIVQHGGSGTPELISGVYGITHNYNDMLQRVLKKGVHVFAPQLLLWDDKYAAEFDRKAIDARLKRVGSSITAIEIYAIERIMDYFETKDYVSGFGMVGLSYGGFYSLCSAAVDTRIKSAISCSYFCGRDAVGWSDWTWFKSAFCFDDAQIACLIYPRKLYIEMGDNDELFDWKISEKSFKKVKKICKNNCDWVEFKIFKGCHEFYLQDDHIEKFISDILA